MAVQWGVPRGGAGREGPRQQEETGPRVRGGAAAAAAAEFVLTRALRRGGRTPACRPRSPGRAAAPWRGPGLVPPRTAEPPRARRQRRCRCSKARSGRRGAVRARAKARGSRLSSVQHRRDSAPGLRDRRDRDSPRTVSCARLSCFLLINAPSCKWHLELQAGVQGARAGASRSLAGDRPQTPVQQALASLGGRQPRPGPAVASSRVCIFK